MPSHAARHACHKTRSLITYAPAKLFNAALTPKTRNTRKTAAPLLEPQVAYSCFDPDGCCSGGKINTGRTDTHRTPSNTVYATQITSHRITPENKKKEITLARQSASARCPRALGTYDTNDNIIIYWYFLFGSVRARGALHAKHPSRQKASTPPPTPMGERYTINSSVFDNTQHTAQYLNPPLAPLTNSTHAGDDPSTKERKKKKMGFTSSNASTASA